MASSTSSPVQPEVVATPPPAPSSPNFATMNPNSSSSSISSITVQNISCMVPTKLKRDNYLVWKALFAPIFRRYKLTGIVDGSKICPPPFVLDLNSTLSEDIVPFTVGVTSSRDLWLNLEHRFGGVSAAHIHQLRSRLHSIHKGDLSISDYLQRIKGLADSLMAAGAFVSDPDLITVTLNGLPDEYESFIDSIMLRISTTTLDELHGLLLNKEVFMHRKKKCVASSASEPFQAFTAQFQPPLLPTPSQFYNFPQAFAAQQSSYSAPSKFHNNNRDRGFSQRNHRGNFSKNFNNRGQFNNSGGNHGNYRNTSGNRNHFGGNRGQFHNSGGLTSCQICNSFDHKALDCYARMNHAFAGKIPPAQLAAMCVHTNSKPSSPTWLMDSGMAIHHTGNSTVSTPHASFRLNNILHDRSSGRMLFRGPVKEGFYPFHGLSSVSSSHTALLSTKASLKTWHHRLGHPSSAMFRKVFYKHCLDHIGDKSVSFFCSDCAIGKNHKLPFFSSTSSASTSLKLLHCDVWGPSPVLSVTGYRFYLLIVDEFTKYTWICPHTSEQNGCVERKHRHLTEIARTLLVSSRVPHKFWVEAFATALYLINRLPISRLDTSPWELLFRRSPDYSKLKVFGCSCYLWLKPYVSSNLDDKSKHCVFLSYSLQHKGYRCLDLQSERIYISRHVLFNEEHFPFHDARHLSSSSLPQSTASTSYPLFTLPFPSFQHTPASSPISSSPLVPPALSQPLSSSSVPSSSSSSPSSASLP
ncbi:hypothetical protein ACFX2G_029156 [Malus domestica]